MVIQDIEIIDDGTGTGDGNYFRVQEELHQQSSKESAIKLIFHKKPQHFKKNRFKYKAYLNDKVRFSTR